MKTAGRRNPNRLRHIAQHPSPWRGSLEQISLDYTGWEGRKTPADAIVFFLDFPLYRTHSEKETSQGLRKNQCSRAHTFANVAPIKGPHALS